MSIARKLIVTAFLVATITGASLSDGVLSPATAGDDSNSGTNYYAGLSCQGLWYERNAIFANKGYCFKSSRGIATFGRRCYAPYGKLPGHLRRVVNEIKQWERHRGC